MEGKLLKSTLKLMEDYGIQTQPRRTRQYYEELAEKRRIKRGTVLESILLDFAIPFEYEEE